jgi:hypothetical protein
MPDPLDGLYLRVHKMTYQMTHKEQNDMTNGTRITVTRYGTTQAGTVTRTGGSGEIVFVVMDHDRATQRERWFHRCSVEAA